MNKHSIFSSLSLAIIFGGCTAIGPDYVKPDIQLPESITNKHDSNIASVQNNWWINFEDDKLNQAISQGLESNYDLLSAQASVHAILGQFDQAKSYLYPQITANASMDQKTTSNASAGSRFPQEGTISTYAANLSLVSYEIDLFGKVRRANEAARSSLLSSEFAKETLKLSIASAIAASYFKLASINDQLLLAKENVKVTRDIHQMTELKYQHGFIAQTALLQAESEWQNAQSTLSQLESTKSIEEALFNTLISQNPKTVATTTLDSIVLPDIPHSLSSTLLEQRPDIASAEQNLIAANAKIGVAKASYFPSIKLTGMLGVQSLELSDLVSNPARILDIAPSLSIPLFSAGRIEGEIKTAEAESAKALYAYKKSILNAFNDTDSALTQCSRAKEQINFQFKRVMAIEKAYEQSRLKYQVGTISYNDMLIMQQQWLQAKQSYIISKQNGLIASVNLYKALGGGWKSSQAVIPDLLPAGR